MALLSYGKGVFANPKADSVFRNMFGTPKFEALTISLINSIIPDLHVVSVEFPNPQILTGVNADRKSVIDVFCKLDNGERVIIEMQNAPQAYFAHRMVFYTSQVISTLDGQKGEEWNYFFSNTYVIAFLNFNLQETLTDPDAENPVICNFKTLNTGTGCKLPGSPEFYFVQLPKFTKTLSELRTVTDFWLYSLIEAQEHDTVPENMADKKLFSTFYAGLLRANFSNDQEINYINDMTTQRDINNQIKFAQEKGYAEGEAKGKAEGLTEGKMDDARAMLADGLSIDKISRYTGLSKDVIEGLGNNS